MSFFLLQSVFHSAFTSTNFGQSQHDANLNLFKGKDVLVSQPTASQSRSQSPRYPCPAERENEDLWDEAFPITGFLLFRSNCAGVSV